MNWYKKASTIEKEQPTFKCPICGSPKISCCRCSGPHSLEALKKGHGLTCKNGHRWSGKLTYDPNKERL